MYGMTKFPSSLEPDNTSQSAALYIPGQSVLPASDLSLALHQTMVK